MGAVQITRRYDFVSYVEASAGLRLATSGTRGDAAATPHFFDGTMRAPRGLVQVLLVVARVASSHFYDPAAGRNLDPIVTAHRDTLRFEAFSSCCGVYARLDWRGADAANGFRRPGTTNVDFNPGMRAALAAISDERSMRLSVGSSELSIEQGALSAREKKVTLPRRWLRGLCEVQAYQSALQPAFELDGAQAIRFVRRLAARQPRRPAVLRLEAEGLTASFAPQAEGVRVAGLERLRLLEALLSPATRLYVWHDQRGVTAWEVALGEARLWLLLSPDVRRGFSGEGQLLQTLARQDWRRGLSRVEADLAWQSEIDAHGAAQRTGLTVSEVRAALGVLAARGLSGYDARAGAWFHRELPYAADVVDALQPRLRAARALLESGVEKLSDHEAMVAGSNVRHYVRLDPEGDRCTCRWFARHDNARGPCKHVLAAHMALSGQSGGIRA